MANSVLKYLLALAIAFNCCSINAQHRTTEPATGNKKDAPVTIFYSLNESHSNSWAQCSKEGSIGISFFDSNTGNLIYRQIFPDSTVEDNILAQGTQLEISTLLFDSLSMPHIFLARSDSDDQIIEHFYQDSSNAWVSDTVINFLGEGGLHIYELSADIGQDGSFHLLVLKTQFNPDSDGYYSAHEDANLFHIYNDGENWNKEHIINGDTYWTMDEYSKAMNRQDIKVDSEGYVHIVYGEQIWYSSLLHYATNKTGTWVHEIASNYNFNTRDDGGWYPSLCLDNNDLPHISCTYIGRYYTGSATHAKLLYVSKSLEGDWNSEVVATHDDGYYGNDGRDYTGGITDIKVDNSNNPHIAFSDIASSHAGMNYFNLGNIRYTVKKNDTWLVSTVYRQALPNGFFDATEMYGICLLHNSSSDRFELIGQELIVNSSTEYSFDLLHLILEEPNIIGEHTVGSFNLANSPNPFQKETSISFHLSNTQHVNLSVYSLQGILVAELVNQTLNKGHHKLKFAANGIESGVYMLQINAGGKIQTKKMLLGR